MRFEIQKLYSHSHYHALMNAGQIVAGGLILEVSDDLARKILDGIPIDAAAIKSTAFPGHRICTEAEQEKRLSRCLAPCKNLSEGNCALCSTCGGRPVQEKVRLNTESCPIGEWGSLPG